MCEDGGEESGCVKVEMMSHCVKVEVMSQGLCQGVDEESEPTVSRWR